MSENKRFTYEVTDTGKYYYDNGVRIYPENFWKIIHELNNENEKLKQKSDDKQQKVNDNINRMIYDLNLWITEHHKNCDSSLLWKRLGAIEYLRKLKEELKIMLSSTMDGKSKEEIDSKRFEVHIHNNEDDEKYPDGIIDKENDDNYIRNYYSICSLLNQLNNNNSQLERTINEMKDDIHEIELVIRTLQTTENDEKIMERIDKDYESITKQPAHYKQEGFSSIDAFKKGLISNDEYIGFLKGNLIKYIIRAGKKDNTKQDIDKAMHYLEYMKEYFL